MAAPWNLKMMMTMTTTMMIGGESVEAEAGERYLVLNPANGEEVGSAPCGRAADASRAMSAAADALPRWRSTRVSERTDALEQGIAIVSSHIEQLAPLLTREQGKPLPEARAELASFVSRMLLFLQLARSTPDGHIPVLDASGRGPRPPASNPQDGVCVALVAWNFPVGLLAKKIGPVLLAGGTVVVKPAFSTPLTTLRVLHLMNEALPPGVLNGVTGRGDVLGAALVAHPRASRVHLTGSDATGAAIQEASDTENTRLVLQLSGSDPMIVCADANLEKALQAAVVGRLRNAGQMCIAIKRLYLEAAIYKDFTTRLVERMQLREPGDGLVPAIAPRIRMGPLHSAALREKIEAQLADAVHAGGQIMLGGERPADPHGYFFAPTLIEDVPDHSTLVTQEVFGPVLPVFKVRGLEEAVERASRGAPALNASIWTSDREAARSVAPRLACRQLWINRLSFHIAEHESGGADLV